MLRKAYDEGVKAEVEEVLGVLVVQWEYTGKGGGVVGVWTVCVGWGYGDDGD